MRDIWKLLLWQFPPWLTSHSKGLEKCFIPNLSIIVGWECLGKKVECFPLHDWESVSCEDKYTIIQVWKRKKKRFPDSKFHCLCAVVMCKGRALCGRDIVLYGKDIISRSRRAWNKVQSLPSLVPRLGLSETHCKQRCLVEDCCQ